MVSKRFPVAVIGAGLSGLVCAEKWSEKGRSEKIELEVRLKGVPGFHLVTLRKIAKSFIGANRSG